MLKKREILLFYVLLTRGGYACSFYIYHDLISYHFWSFLLLQALLSKNSFIASFLWAQSC